MKNKLGHLLAAFVAFVWGVTFVSSKILLDDYSPLEIMYMRFVLAYVGLWIIRPKHHPFRSFREESIFLIAGVTGVFGYFMLENSAMIYTSVSNTGLILAAAPLFVSIILHVFKQDERFELKILIGFILAMLGVGIIVFNGQVVLKLNGFGDFLAIMAAVIWGFYSLALKQMDRTISSIIITRRTFFYGIIIATPFVFALEGGINFAPLFEGNGWIHIVFLGIVASGICYVFWNLSIRLIGAVKTSNYIYLMPLYTMAASAIVLKEAITPLMYVGCGLILCGVYISERGWIIPGRKKLPEIIPESE